MAQRLIARMGKPCRWLLFVPLLVIASSALAEEEGFWSKVKKEASEVKEGVKSGSKGIWGEIKEAGKNTGRAIKEEAKESKTQVEERVSD